MMENMSSFDAKGYYEVLELTFKADAQDIKYNYRNIAKIWHPDQNSDEHALEKFQQISVAYDVLKDDKKRLIYDLLSQTYTSQSFPDMFSLKVYKNQSGDEDAFVRGIRLNRVVGKFIKYSFKDNLEVCNFAEAKKMVFKVSVCNWLLGWWSPKSFLLNIKSIITNIKNIGKNDDENFCLLVHNALAYWQEGQNEKSLLCVLQANEYANTAQKRLLQSLAGFLGVKVKSKPLSWNYSILKLLQLIFPCFIVLLFLVPMSPKIMEIDELHKYLSKDKEVNYYQEVKFSGTKGRTFDDILVSKILNIPADIDDVTMLYHVVGKTKVMHAPGEEFDVLKTIASKTTVRVTGYTPDKVWYRIMLDSGELGFVRRESLSKGVGNEIPDTNKIYKKLI